MNQGQFPIFEEPFPVADRSTSRAINQRAIMDKIYQENGISKAQLAKDLGISKPAVSSNVADLISIGVVLEKGEGVSSASGGRKPVMLYFNDSHSYVGVVDLSFQVPVCIVFDLKCHIIGLEKIHVSDIASQENRRQCIKQAFLKILLKAEIPLEKLGVVIISQPGVSTDNMDAFYISDRHYPWTELGLRPFLQQELAVPVLIKNDVNLAAVGEVHFGTDAPLRDLIYVSCGIGLGAGLVIEGQLYEGRKRAAGEIGFMLQHDGRHFEDGVAMDGLIGRAQKLYAASGKDETLTFPLIVERLKDGDVLLEQAVYEVGRELGRIIQNCCVLLDIPTVIFGGEYLELGPVLFQGMRDFMETTTISRYELIPSALTNAASFYGGFVIGKEKILTALVGGRI